MRYHLDFTPARPGFEISHKEKLFLTGSCFSENMGAYFSERRFSCLSNPNGILFNPLSIAVCLENILRQTPPVADQLIRRNDGYYSYLHHSSIQSASESDLLEKITLSNKNSLAFLKTCQFLFITFGSAFYYRHLGLDIPVANCHKQPGSQFEKKLLTVEEIVRRFKQVISGLTGINPSLRTVFTVSPVKYLKDGVVENNLSKATLLLAVNEIVKENDHCTYFPAFELVNDDLRDYRFYKEDLAHPNEQAIKYVWDKLSNTYFGEQTRKLNLMIEDLNKALAHRPVGFQRSDAALQEYIEKQKKAIAKVAPDLGF